MRDALKVDDVNVSSILSDKYYEHVIELSVYNKNLGNIQGRNTIIWEVRNY
jgi:hypothetical protein